MKYKDPIYGEIEITEPIVLDLISSNPIQRLIDVTQHGATVYNKEFTKRIYSRFEHSLGVYILLRKLDCSIEEQIAGLLHDVGHTVFSHVADLLFPHAESSFDDRSQVSIINKSEIPSILRKYNINTEYILEKKNFPILEKSLPNLCADRIDYCFRDMNLFKKVDAEIFINNMSKVNNVIVFNKPEVGLDFAEKYLNMDKSFWANPFQEYLYAVLAKLITVAFKKNILSLEDLHTTERRVMDTILSSKDHDIEKLRDIILNSSSSDILISETQRDDFYRIKSKVRIVDPQVVYHSKTKRVSEIFTKFKKDMDDYSLKASKAKWIGIRN